VHHGRPRGNPGKARTGRGSDLRPLEDFLIPLMNFWETETGTNFGHAVHTADDLEGVPREGTSASMEFLDHAASCLPQGYSISSIETVVRTIKRLPQQQ
jgi:hypothetical protein